LLNILWDGGALPISRRTSESFTVRGARLTVALQIQEPTIRAFFESCAGLARGTGFLSRFLVACPESTQGFRPFSEPPASWPTLETYRRRLLALLDSPAPLQADGSLCPVLLEFSPEGKAEWVRFYDDVEAELRADGELADVRDVAAKAADNVARLACLFHLLEYGPGGMIGAEHVRAAAQIVAWHLTEARRFLNAIALPAEQANAVLLDKWLIGRARGSGTGWVSTRDVLQWGPNPVRRADARDRALEVLADAGRIRVDQDGRQKRIRLNPALLAP
jgi:putative DNA primase/helicase